MLRKSLAEARRLISGLRPPILDEMGIAAAIGHMINDVAAQGGPEIDYRSRVDFERLEPVLENTIYRVVQECLTNAQRVTVSPTRCIELLQQDDQLRIEVTDWGVGFDPQQEREGSFGLEGIKQRVRLLGGQVSVVSAPGEGTRIVVQLSLASRQSAGTVTAKRRCYQSNLQECAVLFGSVGLLVGCNRQHGSGEIFSLLIRYFQRATR